MRIVHIGLADTFTEGMTYQGNQLSHQNIVDGNEVLFISNAQKFVGGIATDTGYENLVLDDGMRLIRLPYIKIFGATIASKIRYVKGLYDILNNYNPDIILSHSLDYLSVLDVVRYKRLHSTVKFYADTHAAVYNSGRNWASEHILHNIFYRYLHKKAIPYLEKYFYVGESEKEFAIKHYKVPEKIMEFFPLGGNLYDSNEYLRIREKRRLELGLSPKQILFVHSGKLTEEKRTVELLNAFVSVKNDGMKLMLIGTISEDIKQTVLSLIGTDSRIGFLGWKTGSELKEYLCACDMYCQPGSMSATMQNAICCNCAVMSYPHLTYTQHMDWGNIIWVKSQNDMEESFQYISTHTEQLCEMRKNSHNCAEELLDYGKIAEQLYD